MAKKVQASNTKKAEATVEKKSSSFSFNVDWVHVFILSALFWMIYLWIFNSNYVDLNGDNFAYFLLGRGLAEGHGYVNATSIHPTPQIHFPPGFPFIIATCIKLFNADMMDVSFAMGMFYFVSILLFYFTLTKIQASKALAFVVSIFVLLNQLLMSSAVSCMSEIPFVLASIAGIFFLVRSANDDNPLKSWKLLLSVGAFAIGYYIKSIGIALFGAMFLYFLFSKKWKHLLVSTGAYVLMVLPWYIRGKQVGSSYASQLMQVNPYKPELGNLTMATFIERIENNFIRYVSLDIPTSIFGLELTTEKTPLSFWITGIVIIAFILFGIFRLKDYKFFFLGYIVAVFTILLAWPDAFGGLRFIEVLVPVFLFLFIYGIIGMVEFVLGKLSITSFSPYWLLFFAMYYYSPLETLKNKLTEPTPQNYRNYFELAKWAKANTPKDAVFSARKPDMFMYFADRITIGDKPSLNDTVVLDYFRENSVDYVVLEQLGFASTAKYLYPAIQKNQAKFPIAIQLPNPDTYLLKFTEGDR